MLLCRAELAVRGLVATVVTSYQAGLLLLTNKQLHTLAITGQETEEPADWLQPQVGTEPSPVLVMFDWLCSVSVQLRQQGPGGRVCAAGRAGARAGGGRPQPGLRLLPAGGQGQVSLGGGLTVRVKHRRGEHFTAKRKILILALSPRTERLCDQLVDRLQESVRPRPIPVTRLTGDTETVLGAGLAELQPHPGTPHTVLVAGAVLDYSKPEWEEVTVMLTSSHLLLTHHFYQWQLGGRTSQQLAVKLAERIETIDSVVSLSHLLRIENSSTRCGE